MALESVSSKMTSYDFWAIFLPGVCWVGEGCLGINKLCSCFNWNALSNVETGIALLLLAVLAYLVGLVNYSVCEKLFSKCYWSKAEIKLLRSTLKDYQGKSGKVDYQYLWKKWGILLNKPKEGTEEKEETEGKCSMGTYYKAYYYVITHTYCQDIRVMEAQVAFARSMLLPLLFMGIIFPTLITKTLIGILLLCGLYLACVLFVGINACMPCITSGIFILCGACFIYCQCLSNWAFISSIFLFAGLVWFIRERQRKIFRLVIENYEYLDFEPEKDTAVEG